MEGQELRRRYPLTRLWEAAERRNDIVLKCRIISWIAEVVNNYPIFGSREYILGDIYWELGHEVRRVEYK